MKITGFAVLTLSVLMLMMIGCEREITGEVQREDISSASCFECHTDQDFFLVQAQLQFEHSIHNSGNNTNRNRLNRTFYAACERCHTSEGFIAEVTGVPADGDHFSSFSCFTCHQPHSEGDFGVRVTNAVMLQNGAMFDRGNANLCAMCHQSRRDVNTTVVDDVELDSHWGPHHSNQADMLIGENAYEYAGYDYSGSWHESGVVNGCPSCHMSASLHETIGGHSWNMKNEDRDFENIYGCNVDGCHSANPVSSVDRETVSDFDGDGELEGVQTELHDLLDSLTVLLIDANLLTEEHEPVERVVTTADSAGALYNYLFVEEDRSVGVHNTAYAVGLLKSSINFLLTGNPNGVAENRRPITAVISAH